MKNLTIKKLLTFGSMLTLVLVVFTSCQKEVTNDLNLLQNDSNQIIQQAEKKQVSLTEMAQLLPVKKDFLLNTIPTDNSYLNDGFNYKSGGPFWGINFRFFGGCKYPGICLIIYFSSLDEETDGIDKNLVPTKVELLEDKLILSPENLEQSITTDGFLPIPEDFELPSEIAKELGLESLTIKPGIYKASYNQETQQYENVIVDVE